MLRPCLLMVLFVPLVTSAADAPSRDGLQIDSALVTLIEQVEVPARVEGTLMALEAREGQLVAAGDLLGRIDDAEPLLMLRRAALESDIALRQARSEIRIRVAQKAAEVAEMELKRAREAVEKYKKSVSETELDRLRLAAEKAVLDIEQTVHDREIAALTAKLKQAEEELAQAAVDRRKIVAPLAGMVVQVNHHPGEWVQPGKPVVRIVRVDKLRVECLVNHRKLRGVTSGRAVSLVVDLGDGKSPEFPGTVVFVSPEVNPVNGQVRVWAEVENRDLRLNPGMQGALTVFPETTRTAKQP